MKRKSEQRRGLERLILALLAERGEGKTICPSEAARAAAESDERRRWEPLMEPVREAAAALVRAGRIVVTQRGAVVDAKDVRGPVRYRLEP